MANTTDDASVNLIRALAQNMEGPVVNGEKQDEDWDSFTMIIESSNGRFNQAHGYAYSADGTITAVAARPSAVLPFVDAYISGLYKPGEALPIKFLVQYSRTSGKYSILFEDTDDTRWKVTMKNYKELREELRPTLDV